MPRTDSERMDWLEKQFGCALVNDDNGHWALAWDGVQDVPSGNAAETIYSAFFIEKKYWRTTIRRAIDRAMADDDLIAPAIRAGGS